MVYYVNEKRMNKLWFKYGYPYSFCGISTTSYATVSSILWMQEPYYYHYSCNTNVFVATNLLFIHNNRETNSGLLSKPRSFNRYPLLTFCWIRWEERMQEEKVLLFMHLNYDYSMRLVLWQIINVIFHVYIIVW